MNCPKIKVFQNHDWSNTISIVYIRNNKSYSKEWAATIYFEDTEKLSASETSVLIVIWYLKRHGRAALGFALKTLSSNINLFILGHMVPDSFHIFDFLVALHWFCLWSWVSNFSLAYYFSFFCGYNYSYNDLIQGPFRPGRCCILCQWLTIR